MAWPEAPVRNPEKKLEKNNFYNISIVSFLLVAERWPNADQSGRFWNGLCSRTYASGCTHPMALKENRKYFSCKGKGCNFSCITKIHRTLGRERKEKQERAGNERFRLQGSFSLEERKEGWHEVKAGNKTKAIRYLSYQNN